MQQRHERPLKRVNPSGRTVWVARYTGRDGKRRSAGTFDLKREAQDAIDAAYDTEAPAARSTRTVRDFAAVWTTLVPRAPRTNATNLHRLSRVAGPCTKKQIARAEEVLREKHGTRYRPSMLDQGVMLDGLPFGEWPLMELRPKHGLMMLDVLLTDQGRSAAGAKNILLTLSAMMQDAVRLDEAITNPFLGLKVRSSDPRVQKEPRKPRVLSWADMRRLAAAAGEHEAMIRVAADCGLRLGELLGLHRADMKLGACDECRVGTSHFHVRRSAHDGVVEEGTKRERMRHVFEGGRVVPIPAGLEPLLRAMPRRIDTPLLFPTPTGRCWWEDNFRSDVWNPARKAAGVVASPQDFRHSWITHLRAAGVDAADLAQMAGHSVAVASSVYTHALNRSFDVVAQAVGR